MFAALGYSGVSAAATTWLSNLSPILVLIGGLGLALALAGIGLSLFTGTRASAGAPSGPSGLDSSLRG